MQHASTDEILSRMAEAYTQLSPQLKRAADYVLHMDPWWNPAAEDQASDRAHRIGQNRPVTVYRLVARDTIEEKIVKLHSLKRDLADGLLSGNETATPLTMEDLADLLRERG